MILILDNYDSFTYNLFQYVGEISPVIEVYRNDKISIRDIAEKKPSHIIISPGPGYPASAGISISLIKELGAHYPILGVCLGHQAVGEAYGGRIIRATELMHGKTSDIKIKTGCALFNGFPEKITVGRYHSLMIERASLPTELLETAVTDKGEIMAVQHKRFPVFGIQFHPESILTPEGKRILRNFLSVKA
ncbi:MAG: aminodeoxychorismate/anthranilate synthase component II [Elusimicrobia bacterium RIFOXYB2_FULL_49_7]|nr:MAG: aminodeoxychorismate/anthranilate synthase component II [Elusimicrobia bacterium RIFOXYB2_FULL_49_7]